VIYVGVDKATGNYVVFRASRKPAEASHGRRFLYVIGPFPTVRAAAWAERHGKGNPHFRHVRDAVRFAAAQEG
jgi:hypothetical protein